MTCGKEIAVEAPGAFARWGAVCALCIAGNEFPAVKATMNCRTPKRLTPRFRRGAETPHKSVGGVRRPRPTSSRSACCGCRCEGFAGEGSEAPAGGLLPSRQFAEERLGPPCSPPALWPVGTATWHGLGFPVGAPACASEECVCLAAAPVVSPPPGNAGRCCNTAENERGVQGCRVQGCKGCHWWCFPFSRFRFRGCRGLCAAPGSGCVERFRTRFWCSARFFYCRYNKMRA